MGMNTAIQWCIHTLNLWWGCTEVHAGCDNCYARVFARAKGKGAGWDGVRYAVGSAWSNVMKWQAVAAKAGEVRRVFTGSMMDIFEKSTPASTWDGKPLGRTTGDLRDHYFRDIIPATPNLMHLLLTKRPGNIPKIVPVAWLVPGGWPANVMTGTSPVDQATADTLIPQLLAVPGPHFLSMEPLLGPVDLSGMLRCPAEYETATETFDPAGYDPDDCAGCGTPKAEHKSGIDWVIVGGESGPRARPFDLAWARSIQEQCRAAGVSYFLKQLGSHPIGSHNERLRMIGEPVPTRDDGVVRWKLGDSHGGDWSEWPSDMRVREMPAPAMAEGGAR